MTNAHDIQPVSADPASGAGLPEDARPDPGQLPASDQPAGAGTPMNGHAALTWHRVKVALAVLTGVFSTVAAAVTILLFFNIEENPVVGGFVRNRLVAALQERIDPALTISIATVDLRRENHETIVRVSGFRIADASGHQLVLAPSGRINLLTAPLMFMKLVPRAVTLEGLRIALEVSRDGKIVVDSGANDAGPAEPPPLAPVQADMAPMERLREIIGGAFASLAVARDAVGGRLPSLGIDDAAITVMDRRTGRRHDLTGITSRVNTATDGRTTAHAELKTAAGPFALTFELAPRTGDRQGFRARTDKLELHDLVSLAGLKLDGVDLRTPVSVVLSAEVDKAMKAESASAEVSLGRIVHALDRKADPIQIDESRLDLHWAQGDDHIAISRLSAHSGATSVSLAGRIDPPADGQGGWRISLDGKSLPIEPLARGDKPFSLDHVAVALTALPDQRSLNIDRADVSSGNARLQLNGRAYLDDDSRPGLELGLEVDGADARAALRLWPNFAAPPVRKWLAEHVRGGRLDTLILALNFPPDVLAAAIGDGPIPQESLVVNWKVSQGTLAPLPGLPPIRGIVSSGEATGRTVSLALGGGVIETGPNRRLTLSDGTFTVADVSKKPAEARLRLRFSGGADSLAEFLRNPAVQAYAPKGLDPAQVSGAVEGEATIGLRLVPQMTPADVRVGVNAGLRNLSVDKAFGKEKLENGNLQLTFDRETLLVKGEARLFAQPATVEIRGGGKAPVQASVVMTLDDAARARRGIDTGSAISGPVGVKITAGLDGNDKDIDLDLDLTRVAIQEAVPGLSKRAGAPARARARARQEAGGWVLDRLEVESGTFSARGSLTIGADGAFQRASLSSLKLSQGDTMQLDAERSGGVLTLALKGNSFDARTFLKALQVGTADKAGGKDVEIALRATVLSGFNGELMSNTDLKVSMRSGSLRRFDLAGRLDGGALTARLKPGASGQSSLVIASEDAGAFLRFVDLYNRMRGGSLDLVAALGTGRHAGTIKVKSFRLRDEPAIRRLVTDTPNSGSGDSARLDSDFVKRMRTTNDVAFNRMELEFLRTPGRFDIREATLYGPDIGGSLSGTMDYARDLVDLTGTFVPAYTLNNFFAKVPVLGPFLGGGKNEGLFAVRYNITGRLSAPTLSLNPLTAIAPGFLRKLIDVRGMTASPAGQ